MAQLFLDILSNTLIFLCIFMALMIPLGIMLSYDNEKQCNAKIPEIKAELDKIVEAHGYPPTAYKLKWYSGTYGYYITCRFNETVYALWLSETTWKEVDNKQGTFDYSPKDTLEKPAYILKDEDRALFRALTEKAKEMKL